MANKDLARRPKDIKTKIMQSTLGAKHAETWFYEKPKGLEIIMRVDSQDGYVFIESHIAWASIRAAMKRKDKK